MTHQEIDEGEEYIGYQDALALVLSTINPMKFKSLSLASCPGYVTAENVVALVNSPTNDASLKDGFAVKSSDEADASPQNPVNLQVVGSAFAGAGYEGKISKGEAVKICSGSPLPEGADTVISGEFCEEVDSEVPDSWAMTLRDPSVP